MYTQVPKNIVEERLSTCANCPNYFPALRLCKKCGCYVPIKAKISYDGCPAGFWLQYTEENDE